MNPNCICICRLKGEEGPLL